MAAGVAHGFLHASSRLCGAVPAFCAVRGRAPEPALLHHRHPGIDLRRHARLPADAGQADDQPVSLALRAVRTAVVEGKTDIMSLDMAGSAIGWPFPIAPTWGKDAPQGVHKTPEMARNGQSLQGRTI